MDQRPISQIHNLIPEVEGRVYWRGTSAAVNTDLKMENVLPRLNEMDFDTINFAATWKKWKQTMMMYLNDVVMDKSEEARYSTILFVIRVRGREIFNTWILD